MPASLPYARGGDSTCAAPWPSCFRYVFCRSSRTRKASAPTYRVATGFAYGPSGHVVTANHVVTGCQRITIYWEKHNGLTQRADIVRVLAKADLALLQVDRTLGAALAAQQQRPQVDAERETLGYYLSVPTMSNKRLRVTYGSARLADMVPKETRDALQQSGAIDVNLDILRLDGHLLPGHSGAPIFDMQGRVVGVGSGGLKSGAASVSWAVPASYLDALLTSQERQTDSMAIASLFANSAPDTPGSTSAQASPGASAAPRSVQAVCGGVQFIYTGVRSFTELTVGHEDLNSVYKLMTDFSLTNQQVAAGSVHGRGVISAPSTV
jgi:S1-C subfamily serine protease